ncbi:hypothetical protein GCM10008927_28280 [Amylibacter ulvae]|uniref:Lipoprotein n=1 Tax=Paramylibacter ulvae TaxID=1651968 RepID=A0ABQ3DAD9_9RHOB|nr:hypothetical protein [Amylibacter ulvae]GHA61179.1 hypothetical protein GCM10008927_28280 [Amylibacter ulvae]
MNTFFKLSSVCVAIFATACTQSSVDNTMITSDAPTTKMAKYSPSNTDVPNITRFSHPKGETDVWKTAYSECARDAGITGNIDLILREYGAYNTVDLSQNQDISDAEFTATFWCMSKFAQTA